MDSSKHDFGKEFKKHMDDAVGTFKHMDNPGKFNLGKEFKNAIEIIKLNTKKMHDVSERKTSGKGAIIFIILAAIAMNLGVYFSLLRFDFLRPSILSMVISAVIYIVLMIVMIFVLDFVGSHFFKGKGNFGQLFKVLGYGNLIMVAGIISILGGIAGIWYLVIMYKALATVKKLNVTSIILTIVITIVVGGIIGTLLTSLTGYGPMNLIGIDRTWF